MASDSDWVEDVRRWYRASTQTAPKPVAAQEGDDTDMASLGYEAAYPALQARHWPEAQSSGYETLS